MQKQIFGIFIVETNKEVKRMTCSTIKAVQTMTRYQKMNPNIKLELRQIKSN